MLPPIKITIFKIIDIRSHVDFFMDKILPLINLLFLMTKKIIPTYLADFCHYLKNHFYLSKHFPIYLLK